MGSLASLHSLTHTSPSLLPNTHPPHPPSPHHHVLQVALVLAVQSLKGLASLLPHGCLNVSGLLRLGEGEGRGRVKVGWGSNTPRSLPQRVNPLLLLACALFADWPLVCAAPCCTWTGGGDGTHLTLGRAGHTHSTCQRACYKIRWWGLTGSSLLFLGCDWTTGRGRPSRSRTGTMEEPREASAGLQGFHMTLPLTLEQVM